MKTIDKWDGFFSTGVIRFVFGAILGGFLGRVYFESVWLLAGLVGGCVGVWTLPDYQKPWYKRRQSRQTFDDITITTSNEPNGFERIFGFVIAGMIVLYGLQGCLTRRMYPALTPMASGFKTFYGASAVAEGIVYIGLGLLLHSYAAYGRYESHPVVLRILKAVGWSAAILGEGAAFWITWGKA